MNPVLNTGAPPSAQAPLAPRSLYTAVVAGLLFPLQEQFKRHTTVSVRRRMDDTEYWAPGVEADLGEQRAVVRHLRLRPQQQAAQALQAQLLQPLRRPVLGAVSYTHLTLPTKA